MENQEKGIQVWNGILGSAMKLPVIKVDRNAFLTAKFRKYCDAKTMLGILESSPANYLDEKIIKRVVTDCIASPTRNTTLLSAAAGLPGGFSMVGTIPADLAQFYGHVLRLAQELAYIYGYPSLTDDNGELSEESKNILTLFVGVMSGIVVANEGVNFIVRGFAEQITKRVPRMALTKTVIYPIVKKVAA